MTSQRGTEMANDKVAATYHGRLIHRIEPGAEITLCCGRSAGELSSTDLVTTLSPSVPDSVLCKGGESTGEHVWGKLTEDTMAAYSEADAKATMRMYETLPGKPKRDWTPKPWEIALAMGIVVFILAIFWFVTTYYPM